MKVLEVCTVSSSAYALVFPRAHALNQRHAGSLQVDMLCSDGPEVELMRAQGMHVVVTTLHRSLAPRRLLQSAWNLWRVLQAEDYDVVHLHFGIPGLVGRGLAIFWRKPVWLYQSHGYSVTADTGTLAAHAYWLVEWLLQRTVRHALFQLREDVDLAKRYRLLKPEQMVFIGNGIDLQRFVPLPQPPKPPGDPVVFGMVARFEPIKNHVLLLDAAAILVRHTTAFRLKLIGQGYLLPSIRARIVELGLGAYVEILPYCHDMPAFYHSIDVGVLTSLAEGIPRALLEPMACGKPVICTDVKGSREAVRHGVVGYTVPLDSPAQLAETMLKLMNDTAGRLRMGQAARQHVVQHFDEARIIQLLGQLYLDGRVLKPAPPPLCEETA